MGHQGMLRLFEAEYARRTRVVSGIASIKDTSLAQIWGNVRVG